MFRLNKAVVLVFILLGLAMFILSYLYLQRAPSLATPLPDGDLVVFDNLSVHSELGFVNLAEKSIQYIPFDEVKQFPFASQIFADAAGEFVTARVVVSHNPTAGVPSLITRAGDIIWCGHNSLAFGKGRVWVQDEERVILAVHELSEDGLSIGNDRIVVFNMRSCVIETVVYQSVSPDGVDLVQIYDFAINAGGWLALEAYFPGILIISPEGEEVNRIPGASCPGWSFDGQYFAYITREGVFLADALGNKPQLINNNLGVNPCLSWHFTKNYLAYTTQGALNVLEVESGREYQVPLARGHYPVWRPGEWEFPPP